jgi:hypothetical protein
VLERRKSSRTAGSVSMFGEKGKNENEVIFCPSAASDSSFSAFVSPTLQPQYHPSRNGKKDTKARRYFCRIVEAFKAVTDPANVDGGHEFRCQISVEEAKFHFYSKFGEFQTRFSCDGSMIRLPFAEDLQESLEESRLMKILSFRICNVKVRFLLPWLIKRQLSPILTLLEILFSGTVIASCKFSCKDLIIFAIAGCSHLKFWFQGSSTFLESIMHGRIWREDYLF